jgi:putative Ca2+/H+ antiporter (TMEM165/GDT1 family)
VPVVLLGSRFASKLPLKAARTTAAALFIALALWVAVRGMPADAALQQQTDAATRQG